MANAQPNKAPADSAPQGVEPVAPVADPAPQPVANPQPAAQPQPVPQAPVQGERNTEQFEKLLENNRRLFDANQLLQQEINRRVATNQQMNTVVDGQPALPAPTPTDFVEIDPLSGQKYINEDRLRQTLTDAATRAQRAEQQIQSYIQTSEQREVDRQNKEAFTAYPELNPSNTDKFNGNFSNQTSALILHSMVNPQNYGGKPLTFLEAARLVKRGDDTVQNAPAQATEPTTSSTQDDNKVQASVNIQSQPQAVMPAVNSEEIQALRQRTRYGDDQALAERLKYAPHIVPKEES